MPGQGQRCLENQIVNALKKQILEAARAGSIPAGESGLWTIKKLSLAKPLFIPYEAKEPSGIGETLPPGHYTSLFCYTSATMMTGGELVMHDFPAELNKHLQFMLTAHGRVLVTGLGLGCVARGLLANPRVRHVVVIEKDGDVLNLVYPHMPKERLTVIHANALAWVKKEQREPFDCAWHDLWTDEHEGGEHLQVLHSHMMADMCGKVKFQGAWNFPREQRRAWKALGVI